MILLQELIDYCFINNYNEITLISGYAPIFKKYKKIENQDKWGILQSSSIASLYESTLGLLESEGLSLKKELVENEFNRKKYTTFSTQYDLMNRLRVNVHLSNQNLTIHIKIIQQDIPAPSGLSIPSSIYDVCEQEQGLFIISSQSNNGKSTTLASIINHINNTQDKTILYITNYSEYCIDKASSKIIHKEIGLDNESAYDALLSIQKSNFDIVCLDDIYDYNSMHLALMLIESGKLIMMTVPLSDAYATLRYFNTLHKTENSFIQPLMSRYLLAILCQKFIPSMDDEPVTATEVLKNNYTIKNLIKEGKLEDINQAIEAGKLEGMHLLAQDLMNLVQQQKISFQSAIKYCSEKNYFEKIAQELLKDNNF